MAKSKKYYQINDWLTSDKQKGNAKNRNILIGKVKGIFFMWKINLPIHNLFHSVEYAS